MSNQAVYERQAGGLLGAAVAIRQASGAVMMPEEQVEYEQQLADFRDRAEPGGLNAAWAEGRAMTAEQAIEFARNSTTLGSTPASYG